MDKARIKECLEVNLLEKVKKNLPQIKKLEVLFSGDKEYENSDVDKGVILMITTDSFTILGVIDDHPYGVLTGGDTQYEQWLRVFINSWIKETGFKVYD